MENGEREAKTRKRGFTMQRKVLLVAIGIFTILAGCGAEERTVTQKSFSPRRNIEIVEQLNPVAGDRAEVAWESGRYLDAKSNTIEYCSFADGALIEFVRSDSYDALVLVVDSKSDAKGRCKGEVVFSVDKFINYRRIYLQRADQNTRLRKLISPQGQ